MPGSITGFAWYKKGFALSTWDIYNDLKNVPTEHDLIKTRKQAGEYFVLNTPAEKIFSPVIHNLKYYDLKNNVRALEMKQIIMLDEHNKNKQLAQTIQNANKAYFQYEVWQTDHPFTNKRVALMKKLLSFLDKQ